MKKTNLINSQISSLIANLGHTDYICISDAGLPVPKNINKIDLAIKLGLPKFWDVLKVVKDEAKFEKAFVAKEIVDIFPDFVKKTQEILGKDCVVELITHQNFKKMILETKGVIRTGHNQWYHNIILQSGVTF